jgi:hypothetical protein
MFNSTGIGGDNMSNMTVLEQIIDTLAELDSVAKDKYIKCAISANLIKYKKELETECRKNALAVVEHKIVHLVKKLK